MAPRHFFVFWLILVCVILGVRSCLQCDLAIRNMHEDFMASKDKMTVQEQMDLRKIISHAYVTYQDISTQLSGVIGNVQWDLIKIVEKSKRILKKHLEVFVAEGLCPNKCGLLLQSVMNCTSCQYGLRICQSDTPPKDCGEHHLTANEGEQVVLDCFLPWHSLVVGHAEYHYSWNQGAPNFSAEDNFKVLVVTKESKIVLNQLHVTEQGVYRCFLLDQHGTTLSHTRFILTVIPMPTPPPRPIPTLISPPRVDTRHVELPEDTLIITLAFLTGLSISGSLVIIWYFGRMTVRWKKNAKAEGEGEDT
ncbi:izumo sperm-egg fusion protein 1 isoform 2-T2 [Clarias gariepinus]|uniref:izumo sperm-egg fusion protein 1 isoform X2 n=1 Tax=Clarias gariepinus TaxID=13013 RepID=UPI00234CF3E9|nr:izumo sperm-egg fusion protein 1 isoform X2 [Clarias gariepinus]